MDLYIGLMSGTSLDAVDGVLADFSAGAGVRPRMQAFASLPLPACLRAELLALQAPGANELDRAARASLRLTNLYAQVVQHLLHHAPPQSVRAIGAHGQTVRHRPDLGYTLQLIHGAHLAEATGCAVITDFRHSDLAAGGQGAPLVPAFHALAFRPLTGLRAIVNIGGMANITLVSATAPPVLGYDLGPGNVLLDSWSMEHRQQAFDAAGAWAASGRVNPPLLTALRADPYFSTPPPKSTGRDTFNPDWLKRMLQHQPALPPADVQCTLTELTASLIVDACQSHGVDDLIVCGGGAHNTYLMDRLTQRLAPRRVSSSTSQDVAPEAVEALAFAWLAFMRIHDQAGNLPAATGARGPRILGAWYAAPRSA